MNSGGQCRDKTKREERMEPFPAKNCTTDELAFFGGGIG